MNLWGWPLGVAAALTSPDLRRTLAASYIGHLLLWQERSAKRGESKVRRLLLAAGIAALLAVAFVAFAQAQPGTHSRMTAISGHGSGFVEISPTAKNEGGFTFDVQGTVNIHGAAPNTGFTVSRWPDFNLNGTCNEGLIGWVPLPGSLTTSAGGAGAFHFEVQRGAPFTEGRQFDVIFRAVGTDGTVLVSDCMTVTVK